MKLKLKQKIIDWVVDSAKRAPYQHLGGYMNRYWFFVCPWVKIRVHEILRSDREPHLHSHPWNSISLILENGYYDLVPYYDWDTGSVHPKPSANSIQVLKNGQNFWKTWYGPGSIIRRKAGDYHQIEVHSDMMPAKTLFLTTGNECDWGFLVNGEFVYWRVYLNAWN